MKTWLFTVVSALAFFTAGSVRAESFSLGRNQLELIVNPGFNHLPVSVPVTIDPTESNGDLTVSSDLEWVTPLWDEEQSQITLSFVSSNLVASQTATISVQEGTTTKEIYVHGTVVPLNVVKLVDDPNRSRVYGIHANGLQLGTLLVIDPISGDLLGNLTLGQRPTDLAVDSGRNELLIIQSAEQNVLVVDLATLQIKETILLPDYLDWGSESTSADLEIGSGDIIYYTDGNWAPVLTVFNRKNGTVLQRVTVNSHGIGDFALTSDFQTMIAWAQYGWSAGWAGSYICRFDVAADGTVTFKESTDTQYPTAVMRDPLDTPVLISGNDEVAFVKQFAVNTGTLKPPVNSFPSPVYAISPGAEVVTTSAGIYDSSTGNNLFTLEGNPTVQVVTSDYARLVYWHPGSRTLRFLDLLGAIGPEVLGRELSPADGSIVLPPAKLSWTPLPGINSYRVFFGTNETSVATATPDSPEYLGTVSAPEIPLSGELTAGMSYYWRVDLVSALEVVAGPVHAFTVSTISSSVAQLSGSTLHGYQSVVAAFEVDAITPGTAWRAEGAEPWITFVESTGVTPAQVEVIVDASKLNVGVTNSSVLIGTDSGPLVAIPLKVRVEPLSLTILKSDPTSGLVYGISENAQDPVPRAYLLEIDTEAERITRILEVGSSVTDLAIHNPDGRIYIPNWQGGSLLAVNKESFELEETYAFAPFAGIGYGANDVFRVSAGVKGRLVIEEMDQWIDISIFNTETGSLLGRANTREGGGGFDPTGRYYYHGDNNSSGATIQRYDVTGDNFTLLSSIRVESASYYGSRVVTISEDGSRIFWSGSALTPNLTEEWTIGEHIYGCTTDGRFAFAYDKIYDIQLRKVAFAMPVATTVVAFNSQSEKIVVQRNGRIEFFPFTGDSTLPIPILSAPSVSSTEAALAWTDRSLENSFALQMRKAGDTAWTDLPSAIQNAQSTVVQGLDPETSYEFRIRAVAAVATSGWSEVLEVRTIGHPPSPFSLQMPLASAKFVQLNWIDPQLEDGLRVERRSGDNLFWSVLAELPADTTSYVDEDVVSEQSYQYRITATNRWAEVQSEVRAITVPAPAPPQRPMFISVRLLPGLAVHLSWLPVFDATGYDLERRTDTSESWMKVATLEPGTMAYADTEIEERREYFYRLVAFNEVGRSEPSQEVPIFAERIACLLADNFDAVTAGNSWSVISGGRVIAGEAGFEDGGALWFSGGSAREARTLLAPVAPGSILEFSFRAGNEADDTNYWDVSELGEGVFLEYSVDDVHWVSLRSFATDQPGYSVWQRISVPLPSHLFGFDVRFRWRQLRHSGEGSDTWALDNLCLQGPVPDAPAAPPFILAGANSSTAIALLWMESPGATLYQVERTTSLGGWALLGTVSGEQTWFTDLDCVPATTYAYRVRAMNAGGVSAFSNLAFETTLSQMQEWLVENTGSETSPITAPGPDGLSRVTRFAFNLDATEPVYTYIPGSTPGGAPLVEVNPATGMIEVTFVQRKAALDPGIVYEVQFSDDLVNWSACDNLIAQRDLGGTWEEVRYGDTIPTQQARFCQVTVSLASEPE